MLLLVIPISLVECLFKSFVLLFLIALFVLLLLSWKEYLLWIQVLTRYMYCEHFLPVYALSVPFLHNVLQRAEGFNFNEVQCIFLSNFSFMVHAFSVLVKNCSLPQYHNNFSLRKHEKIVVILGSMI